MYKIICIILSLCLCACGQSGPLYLPDEPQQEEDN
ncbi:MAG: lipoprotein [Legionellales bacterium]